MKIIVATALDNEYTMPSVIMLYSMLENAKESTEYDIYILVPGDFAEENKKRLKELQTSFTGHHITFIGMGSVFSEEKMMIPHISYTTYYRLLLPEVLEKNDKCLYLDGDMLVVEDLEQLFMENLGTAYIGGVKAPSYQIDEEAEIWHSKRLGVPDVKQYVNAGVLLLDLKKLRENHVQEEFFRLMKVKHWSSQDQDILNVACYGKIKNFPFRYNYQVVGSGYPADILKRIFSRDEWIETGQKPAIIHYSNAFVKPWKSLQYKFSDLWWSYFRKTSYRDEEIKWKEQIKKEDREKKLAFKRDYSLLIKAESIVLFGYTRTSEQLEYRLKRDGISVSAFCDNSRERQGITQSGKKVLSFAQCMKLYKNAFFINTSQSYRKEITEQLLDAGVPKEHILEYQKPEIYLERARKQETANASETYL